MPICHVTCRVCGRHFRMDVRIQQQVQRGDIRAKGMLSVAVLYLGVIDLIVDGQLNPITHQYITAYRPGDGCQRVMRLVIVDDGIVIRRNDRVDVHRSNSMVVNRQDILRLRRGAIAMRIGGGNGGGNMRIVLQPLGSYIDAVA